MLAILLFVAIIIVYTLFISRSTTIGKFIYHLSMASEQKSAKLTTLSVSVNGVTVYYYTNETADNSKPVLLLVHGFSGDKTIWHRFAKHAQKDFTLIIPDLLGHGDTPYSPQQSYSSLEQSKMLMSLLDDLGISKYSVIGNSMGGMISMQLLQADHKRIDKCVLLDPAGAASQFAVDVYNDKFNPFEHYEFSTFETFYKASMVNPPFMPRCVLQFIAYEYYITRREQLTHMFGDFFNIEEFFKQQQLADSKQLLIIWGNDDGLLPFSDAEYWQSITGIQPIIYNGIGHMPMLECPKRTYEDCHAFIMRS